MTNRRQEILEAFIELTYTNRQKGKRCSAQQVADHIGCSKVLIFQYFPDMRTLSESSFHLICHEIKDILQSIDVPENIDPRSTVEYLCEIWDSFFRYLSSNPSRMHYFIFYSLNYSPYPSGYNSSDKIVRSILREHYEAFIAKCPDFVLISQYLVSVAALAANMVEGSEEPDIVITKITTIIMSGISSIVGADGDDYVDSVR